MPAPEGLDFGDDDYVDPDDVDLDSGEEVDVGDEDVDDGETVTQDEPEKKYLNIEDYADHYVRVGDSEVLVKDLPPGYMMQRDYTQKTQALAEQRAKIEWVDTLMAAVHENAQGVLEVLRNEWVQEGTPATPQAADDPYAREIAELKAWKAQTQANTVRQQIAHESEQIANEHGQDFLTEAAALATSNRWTLPHAAEVLEGRKLKAYLAAEKEKSTANEARLRAKRDDAVVSNGGSRKAVSAERTQHASLDDAFSSAVAELKTRRR